MALPDYDREDKEALLGSLRDKDFADITCEALEDFLLAALPWKEKYEPRIWRREILSARVENEPLLPVRCEIAARLAGEASGTAPTCSAGWTVTCARRRSTA